MRAGVFRRGIAENHPFRNGRSARLCTLRRALISEIAYLANAAPTEKFVFALNQGGAGTGFIEVPANGGRWRAKDVIHPLEKIDGKMDNGIWRTQATIAPLDYRVIRLVREGT